MVLNPRFFFIFAAKCVKKHRNWTVDDYAIFIGNNFSAGF